MLHCPLSTAYIISTAPCGVSYNNVPKNYNRVCVTIGTLDSRTRAMCVSMCRLKSPNIVMIWCKGAKSK